MCKKYSTAREPYRAKTEYLVRWQHYTDYWDSWEPEENVKDTQTFKRYRAAMDISSTTTQTDIGKGSIRNTSERGAEKTIPNFQNIGKEYFPRPGHSRRTLLCTDRCTTDRKWTVH
jgi:hypothetical protein